jgi:hypothetical protein
MFSDRMSKCLLTQSADGHMLAAGGSLTCRNITQCSRLVLIFPEHPPSVCPFGSSLATLHIAKTPESSLWPRQHMLRPEVRSRCESVPRNHVAARETLERSGVSERHPIATDGRYSWLVLLPAHTTHTLNILPKSAIQTKLR